jgi:hypothetical protein
MWIILSLELVLIIPIFFSLVLGLSGIAAAHRFQSELPNKTLKILEGRDSVGGTWDLFR